MSFSRITILGLGLIGGSLAMAIRSRLSDCKITAYDLNRASLDLAKDRGVIDTAAGSIATAVQESECVILCVPVGEVDKTLAAIAPGIRAGVIVTDVASVKGAIVESATRVLPAGVHFVGGHPMAGREQSGFVAASGDLFAGAVCLTTPTDATDPSALDKVEQLWTSLGCRIVRTSPQQHDDWVAQISHLPHALASALMNMASEQALSIVGPGFRDVTRIAAGDAGLWCQILQANAGPMREALRAYRGELDTLDRLLEGGAPAQLKEWLACAADRRIGLTKSKT
jgi:prephenate dehydrogenase